VVTHCVEQARARVNAPSVDLHRELQVTTSQKTCACKAVAVEVSKVGDSVEVRVPGVTHLQRCSACAVSCLQVMSNKVS